MTDTNTDHGHDHHDHATIVRTYRNVFLVLLVFTILEYAYATWAPVGFVALVLGLMIMACTKAALVGLYFMHLKFEGRWVYAFLIPAGILAMVLVGGLTPDVAMQPITEENPDIENTPPAPVQPGAEAWVIRLRSDIS
jgi:cytochrome c oxidase subunit 4